MQKFSIRRERLNIQRDHRKMKQIDNKERLYSCIPLRLIYVRGGLYREIERLIWDKINYFVVFIDQLENA